MSKVNKYADIVINHYKGYNEDERFNRNSHKVEFLTTMRYIEKFAKHGCKILEIGAGTGAYSITLAKKGYVVTAVELVESNLEVMKRKAKRVKNIECLQGDALDLSRFNDNTFDVVLNLGPMYHLYTTKDKNQAIRETIRVCKPNGICMFAYISCAAVVWDYGVRKYGFSDLVNLIDETGRIKDVPEEVFSTYFVDEFKKQFNKTNTTYITNVAVDSIASICREYVNKMKNKDYLALLDWHFKTCEREDQQGLSSHLLYICKKNKEKLCKQK